MALPDSLPAPHLTARRFGARRLLLLTDEALFECAGVRIAFTGREGGKSSGPYSSLNLGSHVDDDPAAVEANRAILLDALGAGDTRLIVPNQVHGDTIVRIDDTASAALDAACRRAADGADAVAVAVEGVAALLCFADCVPVIVVSPSGRFAVVHAGWRGAVENIAGKTVRLLVEADRSDGAYGDAGAFNVYVGPHIHAECFETGAEIRYDYFNLDDKAIFRDHEPLIAPAPACTDGDHFYYKEKKLSFTKQEEVYKRALQTAKKNRTFTFHWRGGYLTREVLKELIELIEKAGTEQNKTAHIQLNWPQAVLRFHYADDVSQAVVTMDEANEGEDGTMLSDI